MPSRRTTPLPPNWHTIRRHILNRDGHRCTWTQTDGTRCTATTRLEVDHINNPNDHRPTCAPCATATTLTATIRAATT